MKISEEAAFELLGLLVDLGVLRVMTREVTENEAAAIEAMPPHPCQIFLYSSPLDLTRRLRGLERGLDPKEEE